MTIFSDAGERAVWKASSVGWRAVFFWLALAALAVPTLVENARQSWSTEQGEHGPIVLAIGIWVLARQWPSMKAAARPSSGLLCVVLGSFAALIYVVGRVSDQFLIESYALYAFGLVTVYALLGSRAMAKGWFALAYLVFALPAPYTLTWLLTSHLRLWITAAAVATYQAMGFSIVRDGLNILVDQYELAVQEACSGMNSLISLSAIGLVYIQIRRAAPWWYFALMAFPIVGFAIFGNFVRVLALIALTHYFGDAVAQSYLHETAGLVTFSVALLGVMGIDAVAYPLLLGRAPARPIAQGLGKPT
jgi:exosortase